MFDDRIHKGIPRTVKVRLFCINHPEKRWATKNIAPIGCRTIFYNLDGFPNMGPECDCPVKDLRVNDNQS